MAGKEFPLSLVIRAVDRVTKPLREINEKIQQVTEPARKLNNSIFELGKAAGVGRLGHAFEGVGRAAGGVWREIRGVGAALLGATVAAYGLLRAVTSVADAGNDLRNLSVRTKIPIQTIAEFEYVAKQADITTEEWSGSLDTLNRNLGQAKAGTGKLAGLLNLVNPAFLQQLKGAKDNEAALNLLFNALQNLKDPNKRAALASAAFGKEVGGKMANLMENGTKGIAELRAEFRELAGDQTDFAEAGTKFDEQWKRSTTALEGVRNAAAVTILPILTDLLKQFTGWVRDNRTAITEWIQQFATNLPQHLETATTILKILAVVLTAKVVVAVYSLITAIYALGVALLTTPIGWILLGLAAIAGAAYLIYKAWAPLKKWFANLWQGITDSVGKAVDFLKSMVPNWVKNLFGGDAAVTVNGQATGAETAAEEAKPSTQKSETRVVVDFNRAPPGTRVSADPSGDADVDLSMGYAMPEIY